MSSNLNQIYTNNPITSNASTDLMYFMQSPYNSGTDAGMIFSDFKAQFASSTLTSAHIYVGNGSNVAASVAMSGDATISNAGAVTVGKINGATLGTTTATSGNILIGSGTSWVTHAVSGDGTLSSTGGLTVTKTNGVAFAASATTDTTNASNITSGTLGVGEGGTGAGSFTAYSVICGGTTTTGAFQNVSGVGTSGQVLTSNGAGALPTWQNAGSSSPAAYKQACAAQLDSGLASNTTYNNGSSGVGATLTNSGSQSALVTDGYTAQLGDRILVQSGASSDAYNGIYTVTNVGSSSTNWVLTRATDADTPANLPYGFQVSIQNGNTNQAKVYFCYSNVNTIGTDNIELFLVYGFKPHAYLPLLISNNLSELEFYGNVVTARANLSVPQMVIYHNGNPNGSIQGSEGDLLIDDSTNRLFLCTSTGNSNWLVVAPIRGTATLSGGTVTVSNTNISSTSQIFLSAQDNNTLGSLRVSARTAGTSFTITSSLNTDTGVVAYEIFEPA